MSLVCLLCTSSPSYHEVGNRGTTQVQPLRLTAVVEDTVAALHLVSLTS